MEAKETIITEITASSTTRGCKRRAQHEIQVNVTKKQKLEVNSVASSSGPKPTKVYPLFAPVSVRKNEFRFLKRKPKETVLHGVHLSPDPKTGVKIAAFDLDGTLISTKTGFPFPNGADDWKWWNDVVPTRLKELHDDGYAIVIMSNQGGLSGNSRKRKEQWEAKIGLIAKEIPEVPFRIFAATEGDEFRKPRAGMWNMLSALYSKQGIEIDLSYCFYVGDAAGRPGDHSNSDKGLAAAIGLSFHTPEEFFLSPKDSPADA